mmetsp:Transcript_26933/g.88380  ORF Transcript_26933/g.88380 Transcript_26933/m.88380 type:complete len:268 (-) Transcript_26933:3180-3983(-)
MGQEHGGGANEHDEGAHPNHSPQGCLSQRDARSGGGVRGRLAAGAREPSGPAPLALEDAARTRFDCVSVAARRAERLRRGSARALRSRLLLEASVRAHLARRHQDGDGAARPARVRAAHRRAPDVRAHFQARRGCHGHQRFVTRLSVYAPWDNAFGGEFRARGGGVAATGAHQSALSVSAADAGVDAPTGEPLRGWRPQPFVLGASRVARESGQVFLLLSARGGAPRAGAARLQRRPPRRGDGARKDARGARAHPRGQAGGTARARA